MRQSFRVWKPCDEGKASPACVISWIPSTHLFIRSDSRASASCDASPSFVRCARRLVRQLVWYVRGDSSHHPTFDGVFGIGLCLQFLPHGVGLLAPFYRNRRLVRAVLVLPCVSSPLASATHVFRGSKHVRRRRRAARHARPAELNSSLHFGPGRGWVGFGPIDWTVPPVSKGNRFGFEPGWVPFRKGREGETRRRTVVVRVDCVGEDGRIRPGHHRHVAEWRTKEGEMDGTGGKGDADAAG